MYVEITKNGETKSVKERYLQNALDRGWTLAPTAKKSKPAKAKLVAEADVVKADEQEHWDPESGEDWADSEESMIVNNEGED